MAKRFVDRMKIDRWIFQNKPNGMSKLAVKSRVSADTIGKARRGKAIDEFQCEAIAAAIGETLESFTSSVAAGEGEAS